MRGKLLFVLVKLVIFSLEPHRQVPGLRGYGHRERLCILTSYRTGFPVYMFALNSLQSWLFLTLKEMFLWIFFQSPSISYFYI